MSILSLGQHPAALEETAVDRIRSVLTQVDKVEVSKGLTLRSAMDTTSKVLSATEIPGFWPEEGSWMASVRPYRVVGGILQIPVTGILIASCTMSYGNYLTGYTYIEQAALRGRDDPNVKAIQLTVDSPGGDTIQLYELADTLNEVAKTKPIFTVSTGMMCSAAYMLGCCGSPMYMPRVGQTGSIGVITVHTDLTQANAMAGRVYTLVSSPEGGRKAELSSATALSPQARAGLQTMCDEIYQLFVSYVVAARPSLSAEDVQKTEGAYFGAKESLALGLVDKVMDFQAATDDFVAAYLDPDPDNGDSYVEYNAETQAAAIQAAIEQQTPALKAQGAAEERARVKAILDSEEAGKRPKAALAYALTAGGDVDSAKAFLGMIPEESVATQAAAPAKTEAEHPADSAFAQAMENSKHPNAGPASGQSDETPTEESRGAAACAAAGLSKPK